ncbi:MAG: YmdB family metallophosphoesterase, partial [Bdellovibrionales bacterium]|nr:YmdB family metallophosphoesterase [Bdellovibrionales bacterium]
MLKTIFLGDIVGKVGRQFIKSNLPVLKEKYAPDLVIANGENSAGGLGIDPGTAEEIYGAGVDLITTGNHIWQRRQVYDYLDKNSHRIVRPINFPSGVPGKGAMVWEWNGLRVGVLNSIGRVFMPQLADCPFKATTEALEGELADCQIRIVDFHAEATSEKVAMGWHCDGLASLVVGTHTHVQTA